MSKQHSLALYIGKEPSSIKPLVSHVYTADEAMEALAIVVTYVPDVVIIDPAHPIADEVLFHLTDADWFDAPVLTDMDNIALCLADLFGEIYADPRRENPDYSRIPC